MKKTLLVLVLLTAILAAMASADFFETDRLNYFNESDTTLNRTLSYVYTGGGTANVTINLSQTPFNFTVVDDCGVAQPGGAVCICDSASQVAECNNVTVAGVQMAIQPVRFDQAEYDVSAAQGNSTNGGGGVATATPAQFIRIKDDEIFHTLVEFGRGRGNYFFDSLGRTGSASQGTGYPFVPNATKFELTYLHKVFNIGHYFGLSNRDLAENASFNCLYPNNTVVRTHLDVDVARAAEWDINYSISEIEGSFERQGYISQDFDEPESAVGDAFWINCTNLMYALRGAGGNITVDADQFNLTYRDPEPFNLSAATTTSTVANGTQLMDITYTLHNLEIYPVEDIRLELAAPRFCTFVNVKGELFGESQDKYIFERTLMTAMDTEEITLTARCDLAGDAVTGIDVINLSGTSLIEFIPPWEINAYNPTQYVQSLITDSNVTVDLTQNSTVVDITDTISIINTTVTENNEFLSVINNTVEVINNTLTEVLNLTLTINETTININNTVNNIQDDTTDIITNLTDITDIDVVDPSATLFTPEDVIVVDTLFLRNNGNPISGGSCNVTIVDNTLTSLVENATMEERLFGGIPHYTYNVSNVTALGGVTTGKFFGHVRCKRGNARAVLSEISFEVRDQSASTDLTSVLNKLSRMEEFDQEMVFLVTDSFGLREQARADVIAGNNDDAIEKLAKANSQLSQVAERLALSRDQMLDASATPDARPVNAPGSSSGSFSLSSLLPSTDTSLWAIILVLLALLVFMFKREHMHHDEPEF